MAVYPEPRWALTQALDFLLFPEADWETRERRLRSISRLPWPRHAYLPDYLREFLLRRMSRAERRQVRNAYAALLSRLTEDRGARTIELPIAVAPERTFRRLLADLLRARSAAGDLDDPIFLNILRGGRLGLLDFELTKAAARLLPRGRMWVKARPLLAAALVAAGGGFAFHEGWTRWGAPELRAYWERMAREENARWTVKLTLAGDASDFAGDFEELLTQRGYRVQVDKDQADRSSGNTLLYPPGGAKVAGRLTQALQYWTYGAPLEPEEEGQRGAGDIGVRIQAISKHKSIFVFLDGTENGPESGTNVWRLYDLIRKNNDPQITAAYFTGAGSAADPLDTRRLGKVEKALELALGKGMQERILKGYAFIASYYNPGDDIYIFGFGKGAHQARSLAGLLAYAGVPRLSDDDRNQLVRDKDYLKDIGNDILELTKKTSDEEYLENWTSWTPGKAPLLAAEIRDEKINGKKGREMEAVEVTFLGVWDTVPGSSLKDYGYCKEGKGFVKTYFYWLIPGIDKGERYKTDSYPAIHWIAHAISLDEKRTKFTPLLVCPPIANPKPTRVTEVWFPGAHADVGGGYDDDDSNELPGISLNWMINVLRDSYQFTTPVPPFQESAVGLAHWSIGDSPGNMFSDCIDRDPKEGELHESVEYRKQAGKVPIKMSGEVKSLEYPINCPSK